MPAEVVDRQTCPESHQADRPFLCPSHVLFKRCLYQMATLVYLEKKGFASLGSDCDMTEGL